jgi:hypothetical protein
MWPPWKKAGVGIARVFRIVLYKKQKAKLGGTR